MKRSVILSFAFPLLLNLALADALRAQAAEDDAHAYVRKIVTSIMRQEFFPPHESSGRAIVGFALDRDGNLVWEKVFETSGSDVLDAAALKIVRRAFPCKPPANFAGGHFRVPINFHGETELQLKRLRPRE